MSEATVEESLKESVQAGENPLNPSPIPIQPTSLKTPVPIGVFVYNPPPPAPQEDEKKSKRPSDFQLYSIFIACATVTTVAVVSFLLHLISGDTAVEIAGAFGDLVDPVVTKTEEPASPPEVTSPQAQPNEDQALRGRLAAEEQVAVVEQSVSLNDAEKNISAAIERSGILKTSPKFDGALLTKQILEVSNKYSVDPLLIAAIVQTESSFNTNAKAGEKVGLLQIRYSLALEIAAKKGLGLKSPDDLMDPMLNLDLGVSYLRDLLTRFKENERQMLLAYHWDPVKLEQAIEKKSFSPDQSRKYASKIQKRHQALKQENSHPSQAPDIVE